MLRLDLRFLDTHEEVSQKVAERKNECNDLLYIQVIFCLFYKKKNDKMQKTLLYQKLYLSFVICHVTISKRANYRKQQYKKEKYWEHTAKAVLPDDQVWTYQ